jgi:hypothetical protein
MFSYYFVLHFVVTHCASLLPIVFYYCSCFGVVLCLVITLALLLLLLHYNGHVAAPPCFVTLLPSQVPLYPLLLHYSSMLHCSLCFRFLFYFYFSLFYFILIDLLFCKDFWKQFFFFNSFFCFCLGYN